MTREEIKNLHEIIDLMIDKCILADSRTKLHKRLEEVCDLAIKAIEQESTLVTKSEGWIPVNEGLPEENKTVIASTEYGVYPEARYEKEYGWEWAYEAGADYWRKLEGVTAWMPLPKPYEPQERSE